MAVHVNYTDFTAQPEWNDLVTTYDLDQTQQDLLCAYGLLLREWNSFFNLTAITDPAKMIQDHFYDSLALSTVMDLSMAQGLADIGSGGGLPGIPLKIKHPDLPVVLVEVNTKKIKFLQHVIKTLGLSGIEVCTVDWQNFLRTTEYELDVICARASLRPDELVRVFSKESDYRYVTLVYWAAESWEVAPDQKRYFDHVEEYSVGHKQRKLAFFSKK